MSEDSVREVVIDALLPQVPFEGWTRQALRQALVCLGEHPDDALLLFPGGPGEMIGAFCALADARMVADATAADLAAYRVPGRVRAIIALRLARSRPDREAIRRALAWLSVPAHAPVAVRITAATVDAIWHAAGDMSADVSWYTKRGILAGVYASTLLYWLRDNSDEDEATLRFLDRRLADVGRIGAARRRVEGRLQELGGAVRGLVPKF